MEILHQGLTTLLRSAVTGENLTLPEGFSLSDVDELVRSQSLLPMVYRGALNCGVAPTDALMQQYQMAYYRIMIQSEKQMRSVRKLLAAFDQNGIDYIPLKGTVLKGLYPQPELRIMGDADILIRMEQYEQIKELMPTLGYWFDHESSYDLPWCEKNLYAELHKRFFAPKYRELSDYFGDGWKIAREQDGKFSLTQEDEFCYIFSHMMVHFRAMGIGARQIVDLFVYRRTHPDMNEEIILQIMEKLQLTQFYRNISKLLQVWFQGEESDPTTDLITAYIFSGGSWGTLERKLYSKEAMSTGADGRVRYSRFSALIHTLFLPMDEMQLMYNVLFKHPWLCPVYYVVRWVDVLRDRPKNVLRRFGIIRNMSNEKVSTHQQMLQKIGLGLEPGDQ